MEATVCKNVGVLSDVLATFWRIFSSVICDYRGGKRWFWDFAGCVGADFPVVLFLEIDANVWDVPVYN